MDTAGRLIRKSTPKFAQMLTWKYSELSGQQVVSDLSNNHGLQVSVKLVQTVNQRVGSILLAKEDKWSYKLPELKKPVHSIGISRDGTTTPIRGEGYKIAMAGTIGLYSSSGERLHTIYTGAAPEKGKATFDHSFKKEIIGIKSTYPSRIYAGIADGEKANWTYLAQYTDYQILDFYHATSYLGNYSKAVYNSPELTQKWLTLSCSQLKNQENAAQELQKEMSDYAITKNIKDKAHPVKKAVTYYTNNMDKMAYYKYQEKNLPIGSGVVEAACKTLIKQRFSKSGCKWNRPTIRAILLARALILTNGRWNQFWAKFSQYGF